MNKPHMVIFFMNDTHGIRFSHLPEEGTVGMAGNVTSMNDFDAPETQRPLVESNAIVPHLHNALEVQAPVEVLENAFSFLESIYSDRSVGFEE